MIYNRGVTHQNCQTLTVRGKVPIYGNLWVCCQNSKIWQFKNSKFTDDINIYRIICMLVKNILRENLGITKWTSTHRICLTVEYWFLKSVFYCSHSSWAEARPLVGSCASLFHLVSFHNPLSNFRVLIFNFNNNDNEENNKKTTAMKNLIWSELKLNKQYIKQTKPAWKKNNSWKKICFFHSSLGWSFQRRMFQMQLNCCRCLSQTSFCIFHQT